MGWGWDLAAEEDLAATMVVDLVVADLVVADLAAVEAAVGLAGLAVGVRVVAGRVAVGSRLRRSAEALRHPKSAGE